MTETIKQIQKKLNSGAYQDALDAIQQLSPELQNTSEIQCLLGLAHYYQGDFDAAKPYFKSALSLSPGEEDCIYNLGYLLYEQKNTQELSELIAHSRSEKTSERLLDQLSMWEYELSTSNNKKRVLMIAYYYPPLSGSGVFRSLKFSKYLHCYGWDPMVISAQNPPKGWEFRDDTQVAEIPEDVQVIRIDDPVSCQKAVSIDCKHVLELQEFVFKHEPHLYAFFKQQLARGKDGLLSLLQFPMHDAWWCGEVVHYLKEHVDLTQFDAVYTTSGPYSTHLIGFYLQKKYQLPWIADYRDQWTGNPASNLQQEPETYKRYFALEQLLLHHADLNITVVDELVPIYQKDFQLPKHKITSITNGYDEADFQYLNFSEQISPKFTITYSGLLYTEDRDVRPIFKALAHLIQTKKIDREAIVFLYVGAGQDLTALAKDYKLTDIIQTTGYVSHHQALQYNIDSNLLLLLVGDTARVKYVYTGKIFDYLRSGKPILAIAPDPSVVKETLDATGHGYVVQSPDMARIQEIILKEYTDWKNKSENTFLHHPLIEQFERKYLTGKLAQALTMGIKNHKETAVQEFSSEIYDEGYRKGGSGNSYHAHYTQSFYYPSWKRAMSYLYLLDREAKILEIGCGVGQFANMLFDAGFTQYQGLDFSSEAIKQAKTTNAAFANQFTVGDAFQTSLLDGDYDLVILFEILEHLNEDLKLVSRIRPGRKVMLSVPNFMDPYHVRCFANVQDVCNRYESLLNIFDTFEMPLTGSNKLFYLIGERLSS